MKRETIYKSIMSVMVVMLFAAIAFVGMAALLPAGVLYAVGTIVGAPQTEQQIKDASSDLDMDEINRKVSMYYPDVTPLDTMLRNTLNKAKIDSFTTEFYATDTKPLYDTIATGCAKDTTKNYCNTIVCTTATTWNIDDTMLFPDVTDTQDGQAFAAIIVNKSNTTLTIQSLNGPTGTGGNTDYGMPAIADGTVARRMGSAKYELDSTTTPYGAIPGTAFNYAQIFMTQVEEGFYQRTAKKEAKWGITQLEQLNLFDMKTTIEGAFLFGARHRFIDSAATTEKKYTCAGVRRYITGESEYGTGGGKCDPSLSDMINICKEVFTGNNGSSKRIWFYGDDLAAGLNNIDFVQKQLAANNTEAVLGVIFRKIVTSFGELLCLRHPLFSQYGYGKYGLILDMNNIEKHIREPLSTNELDLDKLGVRKSNAIILSEASCPVVRNPLTHRWVKPAA